MLSTFIIAVISFIIGVGVSARVASEQVESAKEAAVRADREAQISICQEQSWFDECKRQKALNEALQEQTDIYKRAYKELLAKSKDNQNVDENIKEAIKFAMTNSHPDKPSGNNEQFIKFHKLYKKYCK